MIEKGAPEDGYSSEALKVLEGLAPTPKRSSINLGGYFYNDHNRLDERSLALHELVAMKVQADPALLDKARDNLRRWQAANGSLSPPQTEWQQILSAPVGNVVAFLVERSEKATRLRQSSPFAGILTEVERSAVFEAFRKNSETH